MICPLAWVTVASCPLVVPHRTVQTVRYRDMWLVRLPLNCNIISRIGTGLGWSGLVLLIRRFKVRFLGGPPRHHRELVLNTALAPFSFSPPVSTLSPIHRLGLPPGLAVFGRLRPGPGARERSCVLVCGAARPRLPLPPPPHGFKPMLQGPPSRATGPSRAPRYRGRLGPGAFLGGIVFLSGKMGSCVDLTRVVPRMKLVVLPDGRRG